MRPNRWCLALMSVFFFCAIFSARAGEPQISHYRWGVADLPLTYRLNVSAAPEYMRQVFIEYGRIGLEDWARVEGSRMTTCYRGATSLNSKQDEKIFAKWSSLPAGIGGWAYYPPVGIIEYNVNYASAYYRDRADLRNLTLHESGHAIGFPHYFNDDSVMAYKYIPYLTPFDLALIRLNYPGLKVPSEVCCSRSDTPLSSASARNPEPRDKLENGQWCRASWVEARHER